MRITTLIENHANPNRKDLQSEHGVSFFIEVKDHIYISDVGQSDAFFKNAKTLGVDISKVEALSISHHHYDHGGGLRRFFKENAQSVVYLRKAQPADYLAIDSQESARYIGLDRGLLSEYSDRIVYIEENQEAAPGFYLLTDIPKKYPSPHGDQRLKMRYEGETKPDTFEHEMVTVLDSEDGIIVLTGCAHNGVLNMIAAAQDFFPDKPIHGVIGGFHLHHEDDQTVCEIGEKLLAMEIPRIITGHCTGDHQMDILEDVLGTRMERLFSGKIMRF